MKKLIGSIIITVISFQVVAQLNGTIEIKNVDAPSLSNNMLLEPASKDISIYLPPSYNEVKYAFPVVYDLKGFGCRADDMEILSAYEAALLSGQAEEMIIVIIEGCNLFFGGFYVNSPVTGNWEDFVRYDVVNYVDSRYRTLVKKQCRAITGHSMGGFGAINIGMRNTDIFNSLYALSPGVFNYNGFMETFVFKSESLIRSYLSYVESIYDENTATSIELIINSINTKSFDIQITLAYGAAFSPDTLSNVPFIQFPYSLDEENNLIRNDSIMDIWYHGCGAWDEKIHVFSNNLSTLDTLIIDYGTADTFTWIPDGVSYLEACLNAQGIDHTLLSHPGPHREYSRYRDIMFPAMSLIFSKDSSKYCTEADIISFELDQQIEDAFIDTVNLTIEAYVYDTTNIEFLIPHIEISDGARMSPLNGTQIDFSFGTVYYRVTSGDGNSVKNWAVNVYQRGLGIDNTLNNESIEFFPNPTSGIINITGLTQLSEVKIYSIQGQLLKSERQVESMIDVSDLVEGIYILNLTSGKDKLVRKIVVDR